MLLSDLGSIEEGSPPLFSSVEGLPHTGPGPQDVLSGCLPDYNADPVAQASGATVEWVK